MAICEDRVIAHVVSCSSFDVHVTDSLVRFCLLGICPSSALLFKQDLDAFYAQVEMVRLGVDEDVPLCVQQWEGVIAVNYPARKRGVTRFDKAGEVKKKCPECILVHVEVLTEEQEDGKEQPKAKVSLARYREASARIFKLILREIERVERASIDEAYLDLTDMVKKRRVIRDNDENLGRASDCIVLGEELDPSRKVGCSFQRERIA